MSEWCDDSPRTSGGRVAQSSLDSGEFHLQDDLPQEGVNLGDQLHAERDRDQDSIT